MNPTTVLWLSLGAAALAVLYGIFTVRWVLSQPAGNARMQEIAAAHPGGRQGLHEPPVHDDRHRRRRAVRGPRLRSSVGKRPSASSSARCSRASPATSACSSRCAPTSAPRRPRRSGLNPALTIAFRGGAVTGLLVVGPRPPRRRRLLPRAREPMGMAREDILQGARRPRVRRLADLDLRASWRRHLHERRRRRRRSRRQGRSRHSRGRPAQPGRHRRQRRRQRRRLRRHGRGPVRDLRRDADRHDAARRL